MNAKQKFLQQVLTSGHKLGIISAGDILGHVTPEVLAEHLPQDLRSALLTASLAASAMTPDLVVDTVGITALAEHVPVHILWGCIADAGPGDGASKTAGTTKARASTVPAAPPVAVPKTIPAKAKPATGPAKSITETKLTRAPAVEPEEPAKLPEPPKPGGATAKSKGKKSKSKAKPTPKPNVRAKAKPDRGNPSKRSTLPTRSEFDVDTDVGEVWESDVEVEEFEIVDEADALGATPLDVGDWQTDEETKAGGSTAGPKR